MSVAFLIDENLRGTLGVGILRHNRIGMNPIDAVVVGEASELPLGSSDVEILAWAESQARIVVSFDQSTMLSHFLQYVAAGRKLPGLLLIKPLARVAEVVDHLTLVTYASDPSEWVNNWRYIP
jgi:hypothetical protein